MKNQLYLISAFVIYSCIIFNSAKAQDSNANSESELEKDIKALISMKNNFSKIETSEINNYTNVVEFGTTTKPINYSYNLSILKNKKKETSAFVYSNIQTLEAAYFSISINAILLPTTSKWKSEYDKASSKYYSNRTIFYDNKKIGYLIDYDREHNEHKTWLFIGSLAKEDIEKYLAAKYQVKDFTTKVASPEDDVLKHLNDFIIDSLETYSKYLSIDRSEKTDKEKGSAILDFMKQFDSVEMKKWATNSKVKKNIPEYLQQTEVKNIIYGCINLLEQRTGGFKNLELAENNKLNNEILYNAKPNGLMLSNAEYVCERNNKTNYNAYYYGDRERSLSLQAFLGILEVYKTDSPLTIKKIETGNKIQYDLYLDRLNIARYIISAGDKPNSVIYIYEPGF